MKSIWWTIAMLVLAAISLLANKVFAQDQPHTNGAAITINGYPISARGAAAMAATRMGRPSLSTAYSGESGVPATQSSIVIRGNVR